MWAKISNLVDFAFFGHNFAHCLGSQIWGQEAALGRLVIWLQAPCDSERLSFS